MKIALAQLNPTVGDLRGNAALVRQAAEQAAADGAELLVTSELLISGQPSAASGVLTVSWHGD